MVLGVTGGIATGKSMVAAMLAEYGAVVVSADELAREAVAPGTSALSELVARFGAAILGSGGSLDRAALADLVFADASAREALNRITHPAIALLAEMRLATLRRENPGLTVYEAPLLFEAGAESRVDEVLVVSATPEIQLQRLVERDRISREQALARIEAQMPLCEKIRRADYLIDNSGSKTETAEQVRLLHLELTRPGHS